MPNACCVSAVGRRRRSSAAAPFNKEGGGAGAPAGSRPSGGAGALAVKPCVGERLAVPLSLGVAGAEADKVGK